MQPHESPETTRIPPPPNPARVGKGSPERPGPVRPRCVCVYAHRSQSVPDTVFMTRTFPCRSTSLPGTIPDTRPPARGARPTTCPRSREWGWERLTGPPRRRPNDDAPYGDGAGAGCGRFGGVGIRFIFAAPLGRHARPCAGHPRGAAPRALHHRRHLSAWMAGTSPAMTTAPHGVVAATRDESSLPLVTATERLSPLKHRSRSRHDSCGVVRVLDIDADYHPGRLRPSPQSRAVGRGRAAGAHNRLKDKCPTFSSNSSPKKFPRACSGRRRTICASSSPMRWSSAG